MSPQRLSCPLPCLATVAVLLGAAAAPAQDKDQPPLPPINPAQGRLEQTIGGLDGPGFAIAASDGAGVVAAACDRSTIQLWHKDVLFGVRTGSSSANKLSGHRGTVTALAWNGGPVLASAAADKKIILWDADSGKPLHTLPTDHLTRALAMSPDGTTLASAGDGTAVQLWDVSSGSPGKKLQGHADWLLCLAFSADGKQLASGGYDGTALLWDVASGDKIRELPAEPDKKPKEPPEPVVVTALAFSADGKQLAVGRADGTIDQVNADNGQRVRQLKGHTSGVTGLAYHPGNALLVSSSKDGTLRLWNPANGGQYKSLEGHTAWVEDVVFLADYTRLASVGADRTVRVWNLTNP